MIDRTLLNTIEKSTRGIYERNARTFDIERSKELEEKSWLDRFSDLLPKRAKVLDVGCGAGEPIARYLIRKGFEVEGLDFSKAMLEIIRGRFPDQRWHRMDMRTLSLRIFEMQTQFRSHGLQPHQYLVLQGYPVTL